MADNKMRSQQLIPIGISLLAVLVAALAYFKPAMLGSAETGVSDLTTIRVAVVPAPPVSLYDAGSGTAEGHAIDIVNRIADRSDITVIYEPGNWATMGASLASNQVDMIVGPVFMSEDRAREFAFSTPIYSFSIVPVVRADDVRIQSLEDLQRDSLRVAVGRGGFDAQFVARNMPNASVSEFPPDDPNLSMLEVRAGRADVAIVDFSTAMRFAREHPSVRVLEDMPVSQQYAGFMYEYGDDHIREFFNVALRNLHISGDLDIIEHEYASDRIWHSIVIEN